LGLWRNMDVAVKEIKTSLSSEEEQIKFIDEAILMKSMNVHKNVCLFVGICTEPLCILTEFCEKGSLDKLLGDSNVEITNKTKFNWIEGIAKGMHHLSEEGIIHKDLACRNILITEHDIVKVSDFGLSRLGERKEGEGEEGVSTYVSQNNNGPLKWMAPEALWEKKFSQFSDVWSFGICIIEITTRKLPYPHLTTKEFSAACEEEHKKLPSYVVNFSEYPALKELTIRCFNQDRNLRPTFETICQYLIEIKENKNPFQ